VSVHPPVNTDCLRASRPLDSKGIAAADLAIYAAHEKDPRPNALFDAAGKKKPLSATDPAQECLRDEWMQHYAGAGSKVEQPKPKNGKAPGAAKQPCPCSKATLTVTVRYEPVDAPVKTASVTITGPITKTLTTDATGLAKFADLPSGSYTITSKYVGRHALVDQARSYIGNTDWATDKERPPLPRNTRKCDQFVYEITTGAGYAVPQKPHDRKKFGISFGTVMLPSNAGDWADAASAIITFSSVPAPEPGDIVAYSNPHYTDATGHVGIHTYPKDSKPDSVTLAPGADVGAKQIIRRQTVSAADLSVVENDKIFWHYYDEGAAEETARIIFRRRP